MSVAPYVVKPQVRQRDGKTLQGGWAVFQLIPASGVHRRISPIYNGVMAKRRAQAFLDGVLLMFFADQKRRGLIQAMKNRSVAEAVEVQDT